MQVHGYEGECHACLFPRRVGGGGGGGGVFPEKFGGDDQNLQFSLTYL